jgi:hypothetical protein
VETVMKRRPALVGLYLRIGKRSPLLTRAKRRFKSDSVEMRQHFQT